MRSKKLISSLFSSKDSQSVFSYPFKILFAETEAQNPTYPIQIAVTVPKRAFKSAVTRNLLKRRTREAYRRSKLEFYEELKESQKMYAILFIYVGKEVEDFQLIDKGVKQVFEKFLQAVKK